MTPKQHRILKILNGVGDWLTRKEMEEQAGKKGFSKALGAPTKGKPKPGTLEYLKYVERRNQEKPFEYRITKSGEQALAEYEREHGDVQLLSGRPSPAKDTQVDDVQDIIHQKLDATTTKALISSRLGQGDFRKGVMKYWGNACAVTGSKVTEAIRASHIKPWRDSDDTERLDPLNGLPLVASLDALFDAGLITFDESGHLLISSELNETECSIFALQEKLLRKTPPKKSLPYLEYHHENVFRE